MKSPLQHYGGYRLWCLVVVAAALAAHEMFSPRNACAQVETRIISLSGDIDFGKVPFGSSAERTLTISNAGNSTLTVSNIGYPPEPVYLEGLFDGSWSGAIASGASQHVTVTFTPREGLIWPPPSNNVSFSGFLGVNSDATGGNPSITLSGVGTWSALKPVISITRNLDFGDVPIGESRVRTLAITNKGNSALTFSNITIPDGFSVYSFTGLNASNTVAPGTWTNVFVLFSPTNVARYGGTGTIDSDATIGSGEFTVSGEGAYPAGQYAGLFYPENAGLSNSGVFTPQNLPATNAAFDNSGYFSATAAGNGGFSGVLRVDGERYPFSGRLSPSGDFTGSIGRKGMSELGVSLHVSLGYLQGIISNETWTANLTAFPAIILHSKIPRPWPAGLTEAPGTHEINILGSTNLLLAPTNNGNGIMKLAASFSAHLSGTLGDGTKFSQGTRLYGGQLPFYVELYDHQGAIMGWIADEQVLLPQPHGLAVPPVSVTNIINGTVLWFKPAQIDTNYPNGFSFQTTVNGPG